MRGLLLFLEVILVTQQIVAFRFGLAMPGSWMGSPISAHIRLRGGADADTDASGTESPLPIHRYPDDENNHPPVEEESADDEMTTSCKQTTTEKCKQQQQLADVVNLVVSNEPKTANNITKREEKPEETGDEVNETNTKEMVETTNNESKNVVNNENREINKPKPTKQPSSGKIIEINFRYSDITTKSVF